MSGQRDILAAYAGIDKEDIRGGEKGLKQNLSRTGRPRLGAIQVPSSRIFLIFKLFEKVKKMSWTGRPVRLKFCPLVYL